MCTGLEIVALLGTAASVAGGAIKSREATRNAERMAEARNERLRATMTKNDALAEQSRATFDKRAKDSTAEAMDADQQAATETRQTTMESAIGDVPAAAPAMSGSAPTVVKSELAKRLAETIAGSKDQAARTAKLGGYGDSWLGQGFKDVEAGRDIGQQANFAAGNMAIMPYQQDIAEMRASKPASPLGSLLEGFGQMAAGYAGSKAGGVPKQKLPKLGPIPPSRPMMGYT